MRSLHLVLAPIFLLFTLPWLSASAPSPKLKDLSQYIHQTWQRDQGLPQDSVSAILQTRDGYLWIGTQEGLVRFDGVRFEVHDKSTTPALKHNDISALVESKDGSIWIGTFGGLVQMSQGRFVTHSTNAARERETISALAMSPDETLWIGTQNAGLNKYRDGQFEFYSTAQGLASNAINDLDVDRKGNLWVATPSGLSVLRNGQWTSYNRNHGLPDDSIRAVLAGSDDRIWIGTGKGLASYENGSFRQYTVKEGLSQFSIWKLFEDRHGSLWIGAEDGSLVRFAAGESSTTRIDQSPGGNMVLSIYEDRDGNIWVGTYATGLNRFWQGKFLTYTEDQGLVSNVARVIYQTRNGDIWIGTDAGGVSRFDGRRFSNYSQKDGLAHNSIRTLLEDKKGDLWIGTRGGLSRYSNGRFRTYTTRDGLSQNSIRALAEDSNGNLWIGTSMGGIYRFVDGKIEDYRSKGLSSNVLRALYCDKNNELWIGSNDTLTHWDNGTVKVFTSKDGLPPEAIYVIYEDPEKTVWLGSYGGGLLRMKDGQFTRYTREHGLFDDVVYQILEDDHHNLWMSCNRGIFRVSKEELTAFAEGKINRIRSVTYGKSDGMISSECNGNSQPAGWKTRDGMLWFPTTKGVVVIDPNELGDDRLAPLVEIEQAIVNGVEYSTTNPAIVPPGIGQVEFQFTALSFIVPDKIQFRYKLEGYNSEWIDSITRRQAFYTNLAPGAYVFRVTACNSDGLWNDVGASFQFELEPHYYQTRWFYGLCLVIACSAACGVAFGLYRLRVWQLLLRERELNQRVEEALAKIKILSGLIPICASCKKIRDDKGYWSQLEFFIKEHSEATFSHGLCPECMIRLYPEFPPVEK